MGDKSNIDSKIINNFSESNISHVLAISGMHMMYIMLIFRFRFSSSLGRKKGNILASLFLLVYMYITGFSPSAMRAGISGIILLYSEIFKLRNDTWENLATSFIIICLYNPFLIKSSSVILSYIGTIGIVVLNKDILKIIENLSKKVERRSKRRKKGKFAFIHRLKDNKIIIKLKEMIILTISVYLAILPITCTLFNKLSLLNLVISVLISFFIGPVVILGIIFILFGFIFIFVPESVFETVVMVSGIVLVAFSLLKLGATIKTDSPLKAYGITTSIIGILFGTILIIYKVATIKLIAILIGIWFFLSGLSSLLLMLKANNKGAILIKPIIKIAIGVIALLVPAIPIMAAGITIGIILIFAGVSILSTKKEDEVVYKVKVKK